ncbi:hypothetical protein V6Z11_A12G305800 [Gossypium hirsutum]
MHGNEEEMNKFLTKEPTKNRKHQHRKERRKSSRTKTGELRLVEVNVPAQHPEQSRLQHKLGDVYFSFG